MKVEKFNLAWLVLTYACNNKCRWCYASSNDYLLMKNKIFPKDKQEPTLNLLKELGINRITLIGGEPSLYPSLDLLVSAVSKRQMTPGIVTNGRKFENAEFVRGLRDAGLAYATFSIEGSSPKIHDYTTQCDGSWSQAMQGISNCLNLGLRVTVNTNISSINKHDLKNTLDTLKDVGVNQVSFNSCGICLSSDQNNQFILSPIDYAKYFEEVFLYSKKIGIKTRLITPLPRCNFKIMGQLKSDKAIPGGPCHIVTGRNFVVDYNGDILPCTHFSGYPLFNLFDGDNILSRERFLQLYNSGDALEFRERMARFPSIKCTDCKENCTGG